MRIELKGAGAIGFTHERGLHRLNPAGVVTGREEGGARFVIVGLGRANRFS